MFFFPDFKRTGDIYKKNLSTLFKDVVRSDSGTKHSLVGREYFTFDPQNLLKSVSNRVMAKLPGVREGRAVVDNMSKGFLLITTSSTLLVDIIQPRFGSIKRN
ncbi:hypothetical protein CDAR_495291 [Caerostris darwini]|uniref:Uncharacterized protein n=1 Tax=Caerostris darwini TaxID=1538125 RepID=A0AAV4UXS8_9ARAC|nr:hypothetical protein CDAR_495291 [Caerostris darwini]